MLCPYCGSIQQGGAACQQCRGLFEPLSRQATQNAMGPWQVRNDKNPFGPGCSYEKLREMAARGRITPDTVIRGPSTRQFWALAKNAPGVAVLLGECHNCHARVGASEYLCRGCGAVLTWDSDRQHLGLAPIKRLPGEGSPSTVAAAAFGGVESGAPIRRPASPTGVDSPIAFVGPKPAARPPVPAPAAPVGLDPSAHRSRGPLPPAEEPDAASMMQQSLARTRLARRRRQGLRSAIITLAVLGVIGAVIVVAIVTGPARTATVSASGADEATSAAIRGVEKERERSAVASDQAPGTSIGAALSVGESAAARPKQQAQVEPESKPADAPVVEPPKPPQDPAVNPAAQPSKSATRIDPGLEQYQVDFDRALALEQRDSPAALEEALEILDEIRSLARQRARASQNGWPVLESAIERMRARLDRLKLKEIAR